MLELQATPPNRKAMSSNYNTSSSNYLRILRTGTGRSASLPLATGRVAARTKFVRGAVKFFLLRRFILCLIFLSFLPAPLLAQEPTPLPTSLWGSVERIAHAEQANPPAFAITRNSLGRELFTFAWITADRGGVRQSMRHIEDGALTHSFDLTLPPLRPRDQRLFPAPENQVHLLWIDDDEVTRIPSLFSALVRPNGEIARGPIPISEGGVYEYSAAPMPDGSLWVAWAGDPISEPTLYLRRIDFDGRPALSIRAAANAAHPALVGLADGALLAFWIDMDGGTLRGARYAEGVRLELNALAPTVSLNAGDRLLDVRASVDSTHAYVFWNIDRQGMRESWFASGEIGAPAWEPPTRINGYWGVTPASGDFTATLAASAVNVESGALTVLTFARGQLVGSESVVRLNKGESVISPPALYIAQSRRCLLWSSPDPFAPAALYMTQDS